jgi:mycothiol synthase
MTLAGLAQLFAAGLEVAMLYVESDNSAANATYERIGFKRHMTSRAYQREIAAV